MLTRCTVLRPTRLRGSLTRITLLAATLAGSAVAPAAEVARLASDDLEQILGQAGTNRAEISRAWSEVAAARREGLKFLLENMPAADVQTLSSSFLLENVNLAFAAWEASPWRERVSRELFCNDVLPYACLNEARDPWREQLREKCAPIVTACKTPGEAACLLNEKIFPLFKVRYSTGRRRPHQSPRETIETGVATCTGLAVLLVDACRSVGIPARVAGTPMWTNLRGNHTWVEVWDGDWHFLGAAEPDPKGLDRAWFVHDASEAKRDVPEHALYASSFGRTGLSFPLPWSPATKWVSAVNVTDRYAPKTASATNEPARLQVRVLDAPNGKRVEAAISVLDLANPAAELKGRSRGETADLNDLAAFEVAPGGIYRVSATLGDRSAQQEVLVPTNRPEIITLTLGAPPAAPPPLPAGHASLRVERALTAPDAASLRQALEAFFSASAESQANWRFAAGLEKLLRDNEPAVRQAAWEAYCSAPIHATEKADFDARLVNFDQYQSPYTVKTVGARPANGWALFIAMHGGGGAPKAVNDSQWRQMQNYYRDHPEAGGYLYVALRAPNDTWNGFYDNYVYPLIDNLVRQFRLFGDIDANKVFIMGYSHGGYGAFAIGPKIPDHFAAIHASAAAPTDGETTGKTLRNTIFTAMVGERDTMYGRYERDLRFKAEIEKLRGDRNDIYPVAVTIIPGNGHTGLPDRDKIKDMYSAARNPVPRELTWLLTDSVVTDFFWLRVARPGKGQEIAAACRDNRFVITANTNVTTATLLFDSRLVDFSQPVLLEVDGATATRQFGPSLRTFCASLLRRGDPELAFSASFDLRREEPSGRLVVADPPR